MRFIRLPEVESLTGLTRSTIYQLIQDGQFPKQYKIGKRAVAWLLAEIIEWIKQKMM